MREAPIALAVLLFVALPPRLLAQESVVFEVDTTVSSLVLEVEASVLGVQATGESTSRLSGSITADLTPSPASFSSLHVTAMDLWLYDDLLLDLNFGLLGRLIISAPPQEIMLTISESGGVAAVTDTSFEQTGNVFRIQGTLGLAASGLIANAGIGNSVDVDSEMDIDLGGSITEPDGMIQLRLPLAIVDTTQVSGVPLILRLNGVVVARAGKLGTSFDHDELPEAIVLEQNYPNPFNPSTAISFVLTQAGPVTLNVYDVLGRRIATLIDGTLPAGRHAATFSGGDLPSGVYLYRLETRGATFQRTMVLLK